MKKSKKTAIFAAFAVLACATVHALDPEELLLEAAMNQNLPALENAITQIGRSTSYNINYLHPTLYKSALMFACENNWYPGVERLLKAGANPSYKNGYGQTALMFAVKECNNDTIAKELIKGHAEKNETDNQGKTVLMYAVENQSTDMVGFLLKQGANYKAIDQFGNNALMWAVKSGNRDAVKSFLKANSVNWEQRDSEGNDAFMLACMEGNLDMVKIIINGNSDFDIEKKNDAGKPILIQLIQKKASNAIIEYIMREYDPVRLFELTDDERHDVEYWAKRMNNKTVERALKEIKKENNL